MTDLGSPYGDTTHWTYDHAGRLLSETTTTYMGATLNTTFGWGVSGIIGDPSVAPSYLRTQTTSIDGQPFWSHTFTRSFTGRVTGLSASGNVAGKTKNGSFSYDSRGRLRTESQTFNRPGQNPVNVNGTYTFDAANNLNTGVNGWNYNANGQLTGSVNGIGSLSGITNPSYDLAGNLTAFNGKTLTYDGWGRLKSLVGAGVNVGYTYDGAGRLLSRTSGGVTTYFLYDGGMLLAEVRSNGALHTGYVWGVNGLICQHTELDFLEEGFGFGEENGVEGLGGGWWLLLLSLYYLFDGFGNTEGVIDAEGEIFAEEEYGSWGSEMYLGGMPTGFGYSGQFGGWSEGNTGVVISNHSAPSVYVPSAGHFAQPSGVGYAGGNPYLGYGGDPNDEAPDAHVDEVLRAERGRWRGVNQLAKGMETGLNTLASLNPVVSLASAVKGCDASGNRLSNFDRILNGVGGIPGLGALGAGDDVIRTGKAVAQGSKWGDRARDTLNLVENCAEGVTCFGGSVVVQQPSITSSTNRATLTGKKTSSRTKVASGKGGKSKSGVGNQKTQAASVTKPIPFVQQDEFVYSRDERTGKDSVKRVLWTSVRETHLTLDVTLSDGQTGKAVEVLTTTREHPFYVEGKGFVPAGGLAIGNQIVTRAGPPLVVSKLVWKRHAEGVPVYNFEVEGDHTYFVGSANGGVWVHNPRVRCTATGVYLDDVGRAAHADFPGWLQRQYPDVQFHFPAPSAHGPDVVVRAQPLDPARRAPFNFAELKPNKHEEIKAGIKQIEGRLDTYPGPGQLFVHEGPLGNFTFRRWGGLIPDPDQLGLDF